MTRRPVSSFGSTFVTVAVAALCGVASGARAQDQSTLTVTGEAERLCLLGELQPGERQITNFDTPSGSVLNVTQLADEDTLTTRAATVEIAFGVMCNGAHRVVLSSEENGLHRLDSGATPGFGSAVPYRADLEWAEERAMLTADAAMRQPVDEELLIGRAAMGDLTLVIDIQAGATNAGTNTPLLSGQYSDVLTLTVEPQ